MLIPKILIPLVPVVAMSLIGQSNFIDQLIKSGSLRTPEIIQVIGHLDRSDFGRTQSPYSPEMIGFGQTISAFDIHTMACEALYPALVRPNAHILDVGCGSGYLTAVFARLNPSATVYGVDCVEQLVELSRLNIAKHNSDLLADGRVVLKAYDGSKGYPPGAPYDAIHVGAAAEKMPMPLLEQLRVGGMMLVPVGPWHIGQNYLKVSYGFDDEDHVVTFIRSPDWMMDVQKIHSNASR